MPKYNLKWLINQFENGEDIDFLLFNYQEDVNANLERTCFNQWYGSPFNVNAVKYLTVGHWILARRALLFNDNDSFERIINSVNLDDSIATSGNDLQGFEKELWNEHKFEIIKAGNIHKFNQNPKLLNQLLDSGNQILVERSSRHEVAGADFCHNDLNVENLYFWNGDNCFGFSLMEVRDFFKENGIFKSLECSFLPPWSVFPNFGINDMFWKMGKGEEYIVNFSKYYLSLSQKEKMIFELTNPPSIEWFGFYKLED